MEKSALVMGAPSGRRLAVLVRMHERASAFLCLSAAGRYLLRTQSLRPRAPPKSVFQRPSEPEPFVFLGVHANAPHRAFS